MLRSLAIRLFLTILMLCVAAPAFAWDIPRDAQELLPDGTSIVLVLPSYERLDARWQEITGAFSDDAPSMWEALYSSVRRTSRIGSCSWRSVSTSSQPTRG